MLGLAWVGLGLGLGLRVRGRVKVRVRVRGAPPCLLRDRLWVGAKG